MKKLLSIIKYIRHFVNSEVKPEHEANDIWEYMIKRSSPIHTIEVFKALEKRAELEMRLEEKRCAEVCRAINEKWMPEPKQPTYMELLVKDPIFEKPYSKTFDA